MSAGETHKERLEELNMSSLAERWLSRGEVINAYKYLKGVYTEEAEILQWEAYQVVGLGAKAWNHKRTQKKPQTHKAKMQLKDRQAKLCREVKYIHIPHVGDVKFSSETGNSVYKTYGKAEWVLWCTELMERLGPGCWETNRSLRRLQVSHRHCNYRASVRKQR